MNAQEILNNILPNNFLKKFYAHGAQTMEEIAQQQAEADSYFFTGLMENVLALNPDEMTDQEMDRLEKTVMFIAAAYEHFSI